MAARCRIGFRERCAAYLALCGADQRSVTLSTVLSAIASFTARAARSVALPLVLCASSAARVVVHDRTANDGADAPTWLWHRGLSVLVLAADSRLLS